METTDNRAALKEALENYLTNADVFYSDAAMSANARNKAGANARAALTTIKQLAHNERVHIQECKNKKA